MILVKSLLSSTYNTRSIVINGKESNAYRSDKLDFCSVEDFNILLDFGINLFIDLRNLENKQIDVEQLEENDFSMSIGELLNNKGAL